MQKQTKLAEEYSIYELEELLLRKKLAARQERLQKFQRDGRTISGLLPGSRAEPETVIQEAVSEAEPGSEENGHQGNQKRSWLNQLLLLLEVVLIVALAYVFITTFDTMRKINEESRALVSLDLTPTPLINVVVLPSGHTPPTGSGGARPNLAEVPDHLQPFVQANGSLEFATPGPEHAHSIYIPQIWNTAAPVVQGDSWEQLKKGVGQHIGSVNPGQMGNVVLSAHNDIFGELFRDLDQLEPGDKIIIDTATHQYTYRVTGIKIVAPTDVFVMDATESATITLISCYPYQVDDQRIVVFAILDD